MIGRFLHEWRTVKACQFCEYLSNPTRFASNLLYARPSVCFSCFKFTLFSNSLRWHENGWIYPMMALKNAFVINRWGFTVGCYLPFVYGTEWSVFDWCYLSDLHTDIQMLEDHWDWIFKRRINVNWLTNYSVKIKHEPVNKWNLITDKWHNIDWWIDSITVMDDCVPVTGALLSINVPKYSKRVEK